MQAEANEAGVPIALVVENDLFFAVRIETTLKRMGYAVRTVGSAAEAMQVIEASAPALAIVDFGKDALAPLDVTRRLKALPDAPPVLGFISHIVLPDKRPAAKEAGCDLLVPNSAVSMRLPQLLERLNAHDIAGATALAEEDDA